MSMDLFEVIEGGEARRLGTLQPTAAWPTPGSTMATVFGDTPTAKLIPRDKWKPVSFRQHFPRIKDQNGIGQCNCSATGNIVEGCRRLVGGQADVDLSAGDLYRRVSGGVDRGSLLEDALREVMENGIAPVSAVPYLEWRRDNPAAAPERKKYRITEALWCPTFDHVGSALQQGFFVDFGVWWYGNDPLDGDGWLGGSGSRGRGGHAIAGCQLAERGNRWGIGFPNTWGPMWGDHGFGIAPEARVEEGCRVFQAWACRGVVQESGDAPDLQAAA